MLGSKLAINISVFLCIAFRLVVDKLASIGIFLNDLYFYLEQNYWSQFINLMGYCE